MYNTCHIANHKPTTHHLQVVFVKELPQYLLCGMPTIQYSAQSAQLSVHKLFTTCIR